MYPIDALSGFLPAPTTEKSTATMNPTGMTRIQLIHEALSRARMRGPQAGYTTSTEAPRSARRIAMQARHRAARELGGF